MPLWIAIGADSSSGNRTIDCICAADEKSVSEKVSKLGHFVANIYLVDESKKRIGKYSISQCANWLRSKNMGQLALELLESHTEMPVHFDFCAARQYVPYFIAADQTDRAWKAVQQAKLAKFENSMYCIEAEKLHLLELEVQILKQDNRLPLAIYAEAAERLVRGFLPSVPSREDFVEIRPFSVSEFTDLDVDKLQGASVEIYDKYLNEGTISAINDATRIVQSHF